MSDRPLTPEILNQWRICPRCGWVYGWWPAAHHAGEVPVCSRHGTKRGGRWEGRSRVSPPMLRPPRLEIPTEAQMRALPAGVTINEAMERSEYLALARQRRSQ